MAERTALTGEAALPSAARLAWMLFMQPVSLHHRIKAIGIEPDAPGWRLLKQGGMARRYALRLARSGLLTLVAAIPLALVFAALFSG